MQTKQFIVVIEEDEDGGYVGSVPNLPGCHSQGDTLDELMGNMREAVELCLEATKPKWIPADLNPCMDGCLH